MAPPAGFEAEGSRAPHGLPRNHEGSDPARPGEHARSGHRPRGCAGDPPHPRPPLRLRGLTPPMAQDPPVPVGRPRAVGGYAPRGRQGTRPHGARERPVLVDRHGLHVGGPGLRRARGLRGRPRHRDRLRLQREGRAEREGRQGWSPASGRGHGPGLCAGAGGRPCLGHRLGDPQALPPPPGCPLHDVDPPAGGVAQVALERVLDDAHRPVPLRVRLHHLHAYRLYGPVQPGDSRRP